MTVSDGTPILTILDARGMKCPLPVLKAGKALRSLETGHRLKVLTTDPGAPGDFDHFCKTTGAVLVSTETLPDHTAITVERA